MTVLFVHLLPLKKFKPDKSGKANSLTNLGKFRPETEPRPTDQAVGQPSRQAGSVSQQPASVAGASAQAAGGQAREVVSREFGEGQRLAAQKEARYPGYGARMVDKLSKGGVAANGIEHAAVYDELVKAQDALEAAVKSSRESRLQARPLASLQQLCCLVASRPPFRQAPEQSTTLPLRLSLKKE